MDRRAFLNWIGVGALASSLPVAIAACQSETTQSDSLPSDTSESTESSRVGEILEDGSFVIGSVADLDSNGFLTGRPSFATGAVIVVRDPANPETLYAVDSFCPHQGCSVAWENAASGFICPCHGSAFAADGSLTNGPATEPLATFTTNIDGDDVTVQPG